MGGRLPIISGDRNRAIDPGTARQALVLSGMLGGQDPAFLITHRGEVFKAFHNLYAAEPAERDAVTRLAEREPGLEDGVQEIGLVDNPHFAARRLEMNGRHLDVEL